MSSPARRHSRQVVMIAVSSAYRWLSFLAVRASACVSGRDSRDSSSACSASRPSTASNIPAPVAPGWCGQTNGADPRSGSAPDAELLGLGLFGLRLGLLGLGVAGLEAGDAAAGVEDLLLARVERVAVGAHVGVDDAVRRGAAGGEGVPAGAGHLGHPVLRVDVLLHGFPFGAPGPRSRIGSTSAG